MVKSFMTVIKILFSCLIAGFVFYLGIRMSTKFETNTKRTSLLSASDYTVESFLTNLSDFNTPKYQEHQKLYTLLSLLEKKRPHDITLHGNIPYDYQFFFQDVIPNFLANTGQSRPHSTTRDPYLLATLARNTDYIAKLVYASDQGIIGTRKIRGYPYRLEMTGTYTSQFEYPTGLFVIDGKIINPVLQKWDGLVIIDSHGKLHLKDINALEYQFKRLDIKRSYQDYREFLQLAEQNKLSVFQTHLLVNNGEIDVTPETQKTFRRRIIFQDRQQTVYVYDSLSNHLTLYETATILREQYDAQNAVNLDMGPYGYCALYENDNVKKVYGRKAKSVKLSNILILNWKSN